MKIRHLEFDDINDIHEIYKHTSVSENTSQLPYLKYESIKSIFFESDAYTLVAVIENVVVGHVTLFLSSKIREKHSASLAIAVHPEKHKQGFGNALLVEAINQADNWVNIIRLELEVHADNIAAVSLYKKSGFEKEGIKKLSTFKAGRLIDTILMSRINPSYK